MSEMLIFVKLK